MFKLLYKELRLAAHPTLFIFMLMGALLLIPAYPYGVMFLFGCLAPFITFMFGRETRDIYYTALLPLQKSDVVKGKILLVVFCQLGQLLISVPFALLRRFTVPLGNPVGIEANVAFYGFGLMIYGVFNLVLFLHFFKTAQKVGAAFFLAGIPALLGIVAMEASVHIPGLSWLDDTSAAGLLRQTPILAAGVVLYAASTALAYRMAVRRFDAVDL